MTYWRVWGAVVVVAGLMGCGVVGCGGGAAEPTETASRGDSTIGDEREEREDGSQITGLMGTIRQDQVQNTLEPRMNSFLRCFEQRMGEVEFLSGEVRLSFRIDTSGQVMWVFPSQTTVGDLAAERCVLDVARRAHFPRPHGGEAEFTWGFAFDAPEDVRLPTSWEATHIGPTLLSRAPNLGSQCGARGVRVTAYVAPGGRVLTAGGSATSQDQLPAVECVVTAVRELAMPDPGSYAAKVTFLVQ